MDWKRQCELIPNGVQTMSKMPCRYVEGVYPTFIDRAEGPYCYAAGGKYVDYPLGLGPIILGHGDKRIHTAIAEAYRQGNIYSLSSKYEGELAQKLNDIVPSCEKIRFLKSGTEACMAAVKIAREYTQKKIILTCGYHGWADWYSAQSAHPGGCPDSRKAEVRSFKYNDWETFERLSGYKGVAAVIMEPYIFDGPKQGFLGKVRKRCTEKNIVLIFDEIITGFRTRNWFAQNMFNVIPDLTCLGKAMANGYPISAVGGKEKLMNLLEKNVFVSSTFGGDLMGIKAALATIKVIEQEGVITSIWNYGDQMKSYFNNQANGLDGAECIGYPCRTFFNFPTETHRSLFWQECIKRGVLFGYAQFICQAHSRVELDKTFAAITGAINVVRKNWDDPARRLEGSIAKETLRLR